MIITVKVHVKSNKQEIKQIDKDYYEVFLKSKPVHGKANAELVRLLSKKFGGAKIISGKKSKQKKVIIP